MKQKSLKFLGKFGFYVIFKYFIHLLLFPKSSRRNKTKGLLNRQHFGNHLECLHLISPLRQQKLKNVKINLNQLHAVSR